MLTPADYTLPNALYWGLCSAHYQQIDTSCTPKNIFHLTLSTIECFPLIGQIISLFELALAWLYYSYCYSEPPTLTPTPPTPFSPTEIQTMYPRIEEFSPRLLQSLLTAAEGHIAITGDVLSIAREELARTDDSTPPIQIQIPPLQDAPYPLWLCPRSTEASLYVQLLFRYASTHFIALGQPIPDLYTMNARMECDIRGARYTFTGTWPQLMACLRPLVRPA